MQYRCFGALHSRLLLAQQCDIERLERELNLLDDWDSKTEGMGIKLKSKACDDRSCTKESLGDDCPYRRSRPEVITELKQCLMEYGKFGAVSEGMLSWANDAQMTCL